MNELKQIQESIKTLNHNSAIMSVDIAVLKSQMKEVMWLVRIIAGAVLIFIINKALQMFMN